MLYIFNESDYWLLINFDIAKYIMINITYLNNIPMIGTYLTTDRTKLIENQ